MSCPKCEPSGGKRRWLWWLALAVVSSGAAWLAQSGPTPAAASPAQISR